MWPTSKSNDGQEGQIGFWQNSVDVCTVKYCKAHMSEATTSREDRLDRCPKEKLGSTLRSHLGVLCWDWPHFSRKRYLGTNIPADASGHCTIYLSYHQGGHIDNLRQRNLKNKL